VREPLRVFIGYDHAEIPAYHVLAHSIISRASIPLSITPLVQQTLRHEGIYWRDRGPTESTEFSLTRFLIPYLSGYFGTSIFLDCDFLCRVDLADLMAAVGKADTEAMKAGRGKPALLCCQHDYQPSETVKFLGNVQTAYERKNWSSLMVFRNDRCRALTPEFVNTATGLELHRFLWLRDEEVGSLPLDFNWLVGEYAPNPEARMLHFTLGGPWLPGYENVDHATEWFAERAAMLGATVPETVPA
jgi:hypothetical protein